MSISLITDGMLCPGVLDETPPAIPEDGEAEGGTKPTVPCGIEAAPSDPAPAAPGGGQAGPTSP